jgi:hypothetical protein
LDNRGYIISFMGIGFGQFLYTGRVYTYFAGSRSDFGAHQGDSRPANHKRIVRSRRDFIYDRNPKVFEELFYEV